MPGKSTVSFGNIILEVLLYQPAVTFPTIAANGTATSTAVVPGVLPADLLSWNMQSPPLHLSLDNVSVTAPNQLTFLWASDSTGITGATVGVLLGLARADGANLGLTTLPAALV